MLNLVRDYVSNLQGKMVKTLEKDGVKFAMDFKPIMKRMAKGNSKLDNSMLIFDLPAGKKFSCCCDCVGCCAKKAQVQYSPTNLFRRVNFELAKHNLDILEYLIQEQLNHSNTCKTVRIHSSGDFFSDEYIAMWHRIIKNNPELNFYAYTKVDKVFNFKAILKNSNFNLVLSNAKLDGKTVLNYGDAEHVAKLKNAGYFVCPATLKKSSSVVCGKDCTFCIHHDKVVFHQH